MKTKKGSRLSAGFGIALAGLALLMSACNNGTGSDQEPTVYTVTFDANGGQFEGGGSATQVTVTSPATTVAALSTAPTRAVTADDVNVADFTFASWNTAKDGAGTEFSDSTPVTADITVYALWTAAYQALSGEVAAAGEPKVGDALTADLSGLQYNADWVLSYQWQEAETDSDASYGDIASAVLSAYHVPIDRHGKYLRVKVTYNGVTKTSEGVGPIGYADLAGTVSITADHAQPIVGDVLTANTEALTWESTGSLSYQWKAGGADIGGATGATHTVTVDDWDKAITVTVSGSKNEGSVTSSPTGKVVYAPLTGTVSITGAAAKGAALGVNESGLQHKTGEPHYEWKRNGTTGIGGDSGTYTPVAADIGSTITVTVSYSRNTGSVTSEPTAAVSDMTPAEARSALSNAITAATNDKDLFTGDKLSDETDPDKIVPGRVVVSGTAKSAYESAILAASGSASSDDLAALLAAMSALSTATSEFNSAKKTGASTDSVKATLSTAIGNTDTVLATAASSADGTDIAQSALWVPAAQYTAFQTAISNAQGISSNVNATVNEVTTAIGDLVAAVSGFESLRTHGTRDALAGVILLSWNTSEGTIVSGSIGTLNRNEGSAKNLSVESDFTVNWWKINGVTVPVFGTSITLTGANFPAGVYELSVSVKKGGVDYGAVMSFTVQE
ncbi:MAG: InlB B-repeat-containing protein [Treponema sp.]|jgi:hypothetical protein|nr:InlB B-repeat-containing protein [Treponema sp.]